jgi:DNA replication protein
MGDPPFKGFPAQSRLVRIPEAFFQEILPGIDDLDELRVSLYTLWYLERLETPIKFLRISDYMQDGTFMRSLGENNKERLFNGLQKALCRGTLLCNNEHPSTAPDALILANTPRGRAVLSALKSGKYNADQLSSLPAQMDVLRPNIFELYEQNIGAITPMMAEILKDAETLYPPGWIEEAIELAVQNNSRRWKYVEAILRKWKENGRDGEY